MSKAKRKNDSKKLASKVGRMQKRRKLKKRQFS